MRNIMNNKPGRFDYSNWWEGNWGGMKMKGIKDIKDIDFENIDYIVSDFDNAIKKINVEQNLEEEMKMRDIENTIKYVRDKYDIENLEEEIRMKTINSYEINERINKHRLETGLKAEQAYGNLLQTLHRYKEYFDKLDIIEDKITIDNHLRKVYILNVDCIGLLAELVNMVDRAALLKIFEEFGGDKRKTYFISRSEDEFLRDLTNVLSVLNIRIEKQFAAGRYRVDAFLPDFNLIIEYDDEYHTRPGQMVADMDKDLALKFMGYDILRLDYNVSNSENIGHVIKAINNSK